MEWYLAALKKYAEFSGRARRKEYWMFALFNAIIYVVLFILLLATGSQIFTILYALYGLGIIVPTLAVFVRRMHDTGRSGGWFFLGFIPLIGTIILLVWTVTEGNRGPNAYGPDPKFPNAAVGQGGYQQEPGYPQHGYQAPPQG